MLQKASSFLVLLGVVLGGAAPAAGQDPADLLQVGETAPDIELRGATRHGILVDPVRLSELRGETVVLAFFFKSRTGG
ncbi:MAG: hypothetical protein PVJ76_02055 [Gemmatimonadota bacterium]|jgi:peroxiredoxin Q/BCP